MFILFSYLDSFSTEQLHGNTGTSTFCKNYITYGSLDTTQTVGGYRVQSSNQVHPCGFPMKTILSGKNDVNLQMGYIF